MILMNLNQPKDCKNILHECVYDCCMTGAFGAAQVPAALWVLSSNDTTTNRLSCLSYSTMSRRTCSCGTSRKSRLNERVSIACPPQSRPPASLPAPLQPSTASGCPARHHVHSPLFTTSLSDDSAQPRPLRRQIRQPRRPPSCSTPPTSSPAAARGCLCWPPTRSLPRPRPDPLGCRSVTQPDSKVHFPAALARVCTSPRPACSVNYLDYAVGVCQHELAVARHHTSAAQIGAYMLLARLPYHVTGRRSQDQSRRAHLTLLARQRSYCKPSWLQSITECHSRKPEHMQQVLLQLRRART